MTILSKIFLLLFRKETATVMTMMTAAIMAMVTMMKTKGTYLMN